LGFYCLRECLIARASFIGMLKLAIALLGGRQSDGL